jgi:hypothetical protein
MFILVVEGRVVAKALLRNSWDQLQSALAPHKDWLRSAGGVDDHDRFVGTMDFRSVDAAEKILREPEIELWLKDLLEHLDSPERSSSSRCSVLIAPGEEPAGFLQFIRAEAVDLERFTAVNDAFQVEVRQHRPDVVGSSIVWLDDERFLETVLFTSEQDARSAESREFPGGIAGLFGELMQLMRNIDYMDVRDPWLAYQERD